LWDNGASGPVQNQIGAGKYTCTVTDQNGCFDVIVVTIISPPPITPKVISTEDVRCHGESNGTIKTEASGGMPPYTFLWSHFALTDDVFNLKAGNYVLTVTDDVGCSVETPVIRIQQPETLKLEIDSIHPATCLAGKNGFISVKLTGGSGGYNYFWSHSNQSTSSFNNLAAGNYNVIAFDKLGCKASIPNIALPYLNTPIEASIAIQKTNSCHGDEQGIIALEISNGRPPFNCNWSFGNIQIVDLGKDTLKNLTSGNYRVTITDGDGCTGESGVITLPEPKEIRYVVSDIDENTCSGDSTAAVRIDVSGGVPPYAVSWNDGLFTGLALQNLWDGLYSGEITDSLGCKRKLVPILLESANNIQPNELISDDSSSSAQGSICLFPSGGLAPYSYQWENETSNESCLKNLLAGIYGVSITDAASCQKIFRYEVADVTGSRDEISKVARYRVFPNPSTHEITIYPAIDGDYKIYNNQGALVRLGKINEINLQNIYIGDLPAGVYSLIIVNGRSETPLRFIKL